MTEYEAYKVHIQYTFNAFCKIVIRHAAIDTILKLRRRWEREVEQYEDDNVGAQALNEGEKTAEDAGHYTRSRYARRLKKRAKLQARKRRGQKRQQHRMKAKGLPRQKGKFTGFRVGSGGRKFAKATMRQLSQAVRLRRRPAAAKLHPAVHRQPGPA